MKKIVFISVLLLIILPVFFLFSKQKAAATGTLVGWWKLDETTQGTNAVDSSGSGNTGIPQGTGSGPNPSTDVPTAIKFTDPRSTSFNGLSQYFDCGISPSNLPSGSSARTISAWIKGSSLSNKSIAGWGSDVAGELSELIVSSSSKVEFHGNNNDVLGSTTLSTGQWYFVAATVTSGGAVTIYVNGAQDGTGSVSLNTTGANCKIGRQPTLSIQFFNGLIDDVRIYNTALTSSQISNLAGGSQDADTIPPTPTPSQGGVSSSLSNSSSSASAPSCGDPSPTNVPDLFQIDTNSTQSKVYFAPVSSNADKYFISYGYAPGDMRFGTQINGNSTGVMSDTLNYLSPNSTYYVRVRAGNGCATGGWSNEMKVITTKNGSTSGNRFYESFLMKPVASIDSGIR